MPQTFLHTEIYTCFSNPGRKAYVTQLGSVIGNAEYHYKKRNLARYLVDYIVRGRGYVQVADERHAVEAGDLVFMKKDIAVDYGSDETDPYEKLWFAADGRLVDAMADCYLGGRELVIVGEGSPDTYRALEAILTDGHDEAKIAAVLLDFFIRLGDYAKKSSGRPTLAERLLGYLDEHAGERMPLDALAAQFHVSKRHLLRVFKEKYGTTPTAYQCEQRLRAAARWLAETDYTVGEIAERLGYCDQSFFSTAFKKQYGMYPMAWRSKNS